MEDDIKIIEDLIKYWEDLLKQVKLTSPFYTWIKDEKIEERKKALENLIARNKFLEYKIREHICIEAHEQVKQLYIPKSKVKEIIENSYPDIAVQKLYELLESEA